MAHVGVKAVEGATEVAQVADAADVVAASASAEVATKKHPLALRWMHWVNFPVMMVMVYSGMRIYWANDEYALGIGGWEIFKFWPVAVNDTLQLNQRLAKGIAYHLTFGWFFVINGVAYVAFLAIRGNWRHIVPDRQAMRDAGKVMLHDLKLRKRPPPQRGKYNAAQRIAYSAVLVMAGLLVVSGFAIYKPTQLSLLTRLLGGYEFARLIHFTMTILLMLFFLTHVLQVARAGWRNFASMISGYELRRRTDRSVDRPDEVVEPCEEVSA